MARVLYSRFVSANLPQWKRKKCWRWEKTPELLIDGVFRMNFQKKWYEGGREKNGGKRATQLSAVMRKKYRWQRISILLVGFAIFFAPFCFVFAFLYVWHFPQGLYEATQTTGASSKRHSFHWQYAIHSVIDATTQTVKMNSPKNNCERNKIKYFFFK